MSWYICCPTADLIYHRCQVRASQGIIGVQLTVRLANPRPFRGAWRLVRCQSRSCVPHPAVEKHSKHIAVMLYARKHESQLMVLRCVGSTPIYGANGILFSRRAYSSMWTFHRLSPLDQRMLVGNFFPFCRRRRSGRQQAFQ